MPAESAFPLHSEPQSQARPALARARAIAETQRGVISLAQLRDLGCAPSTARTWVRRGRLVRIHRGVFAFARPLTASGQDVAAVLACGPDAALSHRSAARAWGIRPDSRATTDITAPRALHGRPGLRVHLGRPETTTLEGVPITTLPRTLLDLAAHTDAHQAAKAIQRAEALRLFDLAALRSQLARAPGHRGAARLREALGVQVASTASELEDAMARICKRARLPTPTVNRDLLLPDGTMVRPDFLWPDHDLCVETDGYRDHSGRAAFGHDRSRDRRLWIGLGIRTVRFTWEDVMLTPKLVATDLIALLH